MAVVNLVKPESLPDAPECLLTAHWRYFHYKEAAAVAAKVPFELA